MRPAPIVALLTDFGHRDPYVGVMKARVLSFARSAQLVDISHEVPPQDLVRASFQLEQSVPYFPSGTVYLCVVDPGVGTSRRPLVVETERCTFVCPDNGILSRCLPLCGELKQIVELPTPDSASATFHGRDIFAPAAGQLAAGKPPAELGTTVADLLSLDFMAAVSTPASLEVSVLCVDHFGNIIFDLARDPGWASLELGTLYSVGDRKVPFARTYGEVGSGEPLLLWNSEDYLELATSGGNAQREWGLTPGQRVRFTT